MPIKKASIKDVRQAKKRAERNLEKKNAYKDAIKKVTKALAAGEKELKPLTTAVQKTLDKAAKAGVIKKNTASRRISRLMKRVAKEKK